jgi:hypothetical protein
VVAGRPVVSGRHVVAGESDGGGGLVVAGRPVVSGRPSGPHVVADEPDGGGGLVVAGGHDGGRQYRPRRIESRRLGCIFDRTILPARIVRMIRPP